MTERWLPVVGYEGFYEVSDHGNVRGIDRKTRDGRRIKGRPLTQLPGEHGHLSVCLYRDTICTRQCVQRLVLTAFVGPCPKDMEAAHNNGKSNDNILANLRWDTPKGNHADKYRHGTAPLGERNHMAKITADTVKNIFEARRSGMGVQEIGDQFGVCKQHVSDIINGKRWQHLGISL